jgi:hypothetical protein
MLNPGPFVQAPGACFGHRRYTSPVLEIDATNGGFNFLHNFFIFPIASSKAAPAPIFPHHVAESISFPLEAFSPEAMFCDMFSMSTEA